MKRPYWSCDCAWNLHRKDWLDEQNLDQWPNFIFFSKNLAGQTLKTFTSDSFYTTVSRHHCLCHGGGCWDVIVYCVGGGLVVALLWDGGVVGTRWGRPVRQPSFLLWAVLTVVIRHFFVAVACTFGAFTNDNTVEESFIILKMFVVLASGGVFFLMLVVWKPQKFTPKASERSFFSCSSSRVLLYSSSRRMWRRYQRRYLGGDILNFRQVNGYESCERVILPDSGWKVPK